MPMAAAGVVQCAFTEVQRTAVYQCILLTRYLLTMGLEDTPLWNTIDAVVREEGMSLFDIELPNDTRRGGALKVFISLAKGSTEEGSELHEGNYSSDSSAEQPSRVGVSFEDCVRVSKRLLDLDEQSEIIPGNCSIEVSSPGINRRLRLPEHFKSAIGERIKVKFRDATTGAGQVLVGKLASFNGEVIEVEGEQKKARLVIPFNDIRDARVDFKF